MTNSNENELKVGEAVDDLKSMLSTAGSTSYGQHDYENLCDAIKLIDHLQKQTIANRDKRIKELESAIDKYFKRLDEFFDTTYFALSDCEELYKEAELNLRNLMEKKYV